MAFRGFDCLLILLHEEADEALHHSSSFYVGSLLSIDFHLAMKVCYVEFDLLTHVPCLELSSQLAYRLPAEHLTALFVN